MAKLKDPFNDEILALLKKIDGHKDVFQAEVEFMDGTFSLQYDDAKEDTRWSLDISQLIRKAA